VAASTLSVNGNDYEVFRLEGAERLPYTLRILLENALRHGEETDAAAIRGWRPNDEPSHAISYRPARILHQDFTGVPAIVDLAAMRNAMAELGGDAARINPVLPSELVIDHSVQVDEYGSAQARFRNAELEFHRNRERYAFLRWG
jgi:aconitate hydratase